MSSSRYPLKRYSPPVLQKCTLEQARLFLVGHAWIGHRGAKELLELLFPLASVGLPEDGCSFNARSP